MEAVESNLRRLGVVWVIDLDEPPVRVEPLLPVSFARVGRECSPMLGNANGSDHTAEIEARFAAGRLCYVAWVAEKLAAFGWVSFEEEFVGELSLQLRLLPGEVYLYDFATLDTYRRNHLYSALLSYILDDLRQEKICRAWIGADYDNVPSQRGIARAGFHPVADIVVNGDPAPERMRLRGYPGVPEALVAEAHRVYLGARDSEKL